MPDFCGARHPGHDGRSVQGWVDEVKVTEWGRGPATTLMVTQSPT